MEEEKKYIKVVDRPPFAGEYIIGKSEDTCYKVLRMDVLAPLVDTSGNIIVEPAYWFVGIRENDGNKRCRFMFNGKDAEYYIIPKLKGMVRIGE